MRCFARKMVLAMLFAFGWLVAAPAQGQYQELTARLPVSGNTLVLIDAGRIYASPLARREHWQADHARGVTAGGVLLPPGAQRLAAAANLDLEFLEPLWEAGVLKLAAVPPLAGIAKAEHGTLDEIHGHEALFLPNDSCIVAFDNQHLGVIAPANRQRVALWLDFDPAKSGTTLAPYLKEALAAEAEHPSAIALAFNLEHTVSAATIKTHVAEWSGDRLMGVTPEDLATMLTSLRGAMVQIHMGESIVGRVRIDFAASGARLVPIAKDLVLETLAGSGAMVPELRDWDLKMEEKAIVLQGAASAQAVERALSIVQLPLAPLERGPVPAATAVAAPISASETSVKAAPAPAPPVVSHEPLTPAGASAKYFHAVRRLLADLRQDKNDAVSMGQIGLWYDTYARKVDMLPPAQVDAALLDYGATVANDLRSASTAVKQGGIDAHQREMQITPLNTTTARFSRPNYGGYGGYGGGYSRYGYHRGYNRYGSGRYGGYGGVIGTYYFQSRNLSSERRKVRADERSKMAKSVVSILADIDTATAKVRQEMVEKYGSGF
jgi:hypothetical protein